MFSRVLVVSCMLLSVTLACSPASAGPKPAEGQPTTVQPNPVTELARGVTRAFGQKAPAESESTPRLLRLENEHTPEGVDMVVPVVASRLER